MHDECDRAESGTKHSRAKTLSYICVQMPKRGSTIWHRATDDEIVPPTRIKSAAGHCADTSDRCRAPSLPLSSAASSWSTEFVSLVGGRTRPERNRTRLVRPAAQSSRFQFAQRHPALGHVRLAPKRSADGTHGEQAARGKAHAKNSLKSTGGAKPVGIRQTLR
jgi:hypothetical protein